MEIVIKAANIPRRRVKAIHLIGSGFSQSLVRKNTSQINSGKVAINKGNK